MSLYLTQSAAEMSSFLWQPGDERRKHDLAMRDAVQRRIEDHITAVLLMIVEFDAVAAVVQRRRDFQNFQVLARELMQDAELFEQLHRQVDHLLDVLFVAFRNI